MGKRSKGKVRSCEPRGGVEVGKEKGVLRHGSKSVSLIGSGRRESGIDVLSEPVGRLKILWSEGRGARKEQLLWSTWGGMVGEKERGENGTSANTGLPAPLALLAPT